MQNKRHSNACVSCHSKHWVQVCGGLALRLFRYDELELLVCGLPHLDFSGLKSAAQYEGGFSASHPTIVDFWGHGTDIRAEEELPEVLHRLRQVWP